MTSHCLRRVALLAAVTCLVATSADAQTPKPRAVPIFEEWMKISGTVSTRWVAW